MVILTKKNGYKLKSCKNKIKLSKIRGGSNGDMSIHKVKPEISGFNKFFGNLGIRTEAYKKYKLNKERLDLINKLEENTPIYNSKKANNLKQKISAIESKKQIKATIKNLPEKNKKFMEELILLKQQIIKENIESDSFIQPNLNILSKEFKDYLKELQLKIYNKNTNRTIKLEKDSGNERDEITNERDEITKDNEINYIYEDINTISKSLIKTKFNKQIATKAKGDFFKLREDLNLINKLSLDELKELKNEYDKYKKDIKDGKDGNEFQLYKIRLAAKILNRK